MPPKPISLVGKNAGGDSSPPAAPMEPTTPSHVPKAIGLPSAPLENKQEAVTQSHTPRSIGLPTSGPAPVQRAPAMGHTISLSTGNDQHDALVRAAISSDPTMVQYAMRLKPRFATLSTCDDDDVLDWGDRNLTALQSVTASKAKIAGRISQIDPTGWIDKTTTASCKPPSLMSRLLSSGDTPQYYQTRLTGVRGELVDAMRELKKLHEEIFPDAEDLRMDIVALQIFNANNPSKFDPIITDGRLRTLMAAQQTVVMTMTAIEQLRATNATNIQTIDKLLQVTIPNWLLATSQGK